MSTNLRDDAARRITPGAYDRTTLTRRQPGSMGGPANGSGAPISASSLDAATIAERELEGGGGVSQRRRMGKQGPQRGPRRL